MGNEVEGGRAGWLDGRERATYSRSSWKSSMPRMEVLDRAPSLASRVWFQARPRDMEEMAGWNFGAMAGGEDVEGRSGRVEAF